MRVNIELVNILMNQAQLWRLEQYAKQSIEVNESLSVWQGNEKGLTPTLESMLENDIDMDLAFNKQLQAADLDKIAPYAIHEASSISIAFRTAPTLPQNMVLWRAAPRNVNIPRPDTTVWMSTSATIQGAENWAKANLTNGKCNIFKLIVKSDNIKALAVGGIANENIENDLDEEEEILTYYDFAVRFVNNEPPTLRGNPIKVFDMV